MMPKLTGRYVGKGTIFNVGPGQDRPNKSRSEYPDGKRWARWHRVMGGYWVYMVYERLGLE